MTDPHSSARNHGEGHVPERPVSATAHAITMEPPNNPLQAGHAWIIPSPITQVAGETIDPVNHLSAGASSVDAAVDLTDDAAQDGSYGTLMLSEGGRSKYLGPTAGSEWLRDVCKMTADI